MRLWDIKARVYSGLRHLPLIRKILEKEKKGLQFLLDHFTHFPSLLLDIGIGAGDTLDVFPEFILIIGLDASLPMILQARKKRPIYGVAGEASRLPFKSRCTEWVSAIGLTEYLKEPFAFLDEVDRILLPGGYFLMTISPPHFWNRLRSLLGHFLFLFNPCELEKEVARRGMMLLRKTKSGLQWQYLYQKKITPSEEKRCAE